MAGFFFERFQSHLVYTYVWIIITIWGTAQFIVFIYIHILLLSTIVIVDIGDGDGDGYGGGGGCALVKTIFTLSWKMWV